MSTTTRIGGIRTAAEIAAWVASIGGDVAEDEPECEAPDVTLVLCEPYGCRMTERACALRWRRANRGVDITLDFALRSESCVGCATGERREAEGAHDGAPPVLLMGPQHLSPTVLANRAAIVRARGLEPMEVPRWSPEAAEGKRQAKLARRRLQRTGDARLKVVKAEWLPHEAELFGRVAAVTGERVAAKDVRGALDCSRNSALRLLSIWVERGRLSCVPKGAATYYVKASAGGSPSLPPPVEAAFEGEVEHE